MPNVTAESQERSFIDLPQTSTTIRTREKRQLGISLVLRLLGNVFRDDCLGMRVIGHLGISNRFTRLLGESNHGRRNFSSYEHTINIDEPDGAPGHPVDNRFPWILNQGDSPVGFDRQQPGRAIAKGTGKDNPDRPRAVGPSRRSEQRINRRAGVILARSTREFEIAGLDEKMVIWRRYIDLTSDEWFTMFSVFGREVPCSCEQLRENRRRVRGHVDDNDHYSREIRR